MNTSVSIVDPVLYTAGTTYYRSPLLFTVSKSSVLPRLCSHFSSRNADVLRPKFVLSRPDAILETLASTAEQYAAPGGWPRPPLLLDGNLSRW